MSHEGKACGVVGRAFGRLFSMTPLPRLPSPRPSSTPSHHRHRRRWNRATQSARAYVARAAAHSSWRTHRARRPRGPGPRPRPRPARSGVRTCLQRPQQASPSLLLLRTSRGPPESKCGAGRRAAREVADARAREFPDRFEECQQRRRCTARVAASVQQRTLQHIITLGNQTYKRVRKDLRCSVGVVQ